MHRVGGRWTDVYLHMYVHTYMDGSWGDCMFRWTAACATGQDIVSFRIVSYRSIGSTGPEQSHRSQRQGKGRDQRHGDTHSTQAGAATITHLITSVTQRQLGRRTQRPSRWHGMYAQQEVSATVCHDRPSSSHQASSAQTRPPWLVAPLQSDLPCASLPSSRHVVAPPTINPKSPATPAKGIKSRCEMAA